MMPSQRMQEQDRHRFSGFPNRPGAVLVIAPVILTLAAAINWRLFRPGLLLSGDNPAHLAEIYAVGENILTGQGWWFGWFEGDFLGYPVLVYQYPLGKLAVAVLGLALPVGSVYKAALILSWFLPALGLFRLLLRAGSPGPAAAVALLYLVSFDHLYLALSGMWNQYLSLGFLLLAADRHLELLERPDRRSLAAAAGWSALALCSHPFNYLMVPLCWGCSLAGSRLAGLRASRLGWMGCPLLAVGLSSWLLVPLLESWSWARVELGSRDWSLLPALFPLALTDLMEVETVLGLLSGIAEHATGMLAGLLLGVPAAFLLRKRPACSRAGSLQHFALLFISGVILLSAAILTGALPLFSGIARLVAVGRFAPYLLVGLLLVLGCFLQSRRRTRQGQVLLAVLAALILVRLGWTAVRPDPRLDRFYTLLDRGAPAHPDLQDLASIWGWLGNHTAPVTGRVLTQDTLYNLSHSPLSLTHAMALTPHFAGAWTIGGFSGVLSPNARLTPSEAGLLFGRRLEALDAHAVFENAVRYGVSHIVSCEDRLETLLRSSQLFRERTCQGAFCVFELVEGPLWARLEGSGTARPEIWQPGRRTLMADLPAAATLWIPTTGHPWWQARVDDIPVPIREFGRERFLSVEVPAGRHRVEFSFRPPRLLPLLVSGLALAVWILVVAGVGSRDTGVGSRDTGDRRGSRDTGNRRKPRAAAS